MRVLVVGATGTLGGMIARRLLARGAGVSILVRPGSDASGLLQAGAHAVAGDLKDHRSLHGACAGAEVVITTANSVLRGGADTVESVDLVGNRNLIDAARAQGVRHFVFVSALGASPQSAAPFMQAKAATEAHLRESGLPYTILQPNLFMEVWIPMLLGRGAAGASPVMLAGEGRRRHSFVSMHDVAAYAVAVAGNPAARDRVLVLGGAEPVSWRGIVAAVEKTIGYRLEVRHLGPGQSLPGLPAMVSELAWGTEMYDSPVDMTELAREFGIRPTSVEEYVRREFGPAVPA